MTDTPPGPGWWLASDGRWYPPETPPAGGDGWLTNDTGATQVAPWARSPDLGPTPASTPPPSPVGGWDAPAAPAAPPGPWDPVPPPPPGLPGQVSPTVDFAPDPVATSQQWLDASPPSAPAGGGSGGGNLTWIIMGVGIGLIVLLGGALAAIAATRGDDDPGPATTVTTTDPGPGSGTTATTSSTSVTGSVPGPVASDPPASDPLANREDEEESLTEQLNELLELGIDFSDAETTDSPASCEVTGIQEFSDDYAVDATITNNDGVRSAYKVEYTLTGADGSSLGDDYGIIDKVAPGATVVDDTLGALPGDDDPSAVTCQVTGVLRVDAS